MLSEAKAMLSEAEREKHDVARKTEALDLKIRAQAEKAAEEAAEREAERGGARARAPRSRLRRDASAARRRGLRRVSQYHDALETVGGGTPRDDPRTERHGRARGASARETTRVEPSARRPRLCAKAPRRCLGGSGGCAADARRAAAADTRAAAARGAERQHPEGSFSFAASARGAERAERRARRRGGPDPARTPRAPEVERARGDGG